MSQLQSEIIVSIRRLLGSPGFTVFAVVTLALGIGATTAIYSVIYTAMLRPPDIKDVDRVVNIYHADPTGLTMLSGALSSFSLPDYEDLRRAQTAFDGIAAWARFRQPVIVEGSAEYLFGEMVGGYYFQVLGVEAAIGRTIQSADDRPGAARVAVISEAIWRRKFNADPAIVGRTVKLGQTVFEVIGVAPGTFRGVDMPNVMPTPIWIPISIAAEIQTGRREGLDDREDRWLRVKARLKPDVSLRQAAEQVQAIGRALDASNPIGRESGSGMPARRRRDWTVVRAADILMHESVHAIVGPMAWSTMAAVGLVLLVACTNLANLLLARGATRRHEISVRLALGASRWRLLRELTIESAIVALIGGLAAFVVARLTMIQLSSVVHLGNASIQFEPILHPSVLAVCAGATLLALLVFGLLPALHLTRTDIRQLLANDEGNAAPRWRARRYLITGQVAVSVLLVALAALCVQQIVVAASRDIGFDLDNLAIASMDLRAQRYEEERGWQLLEAIVGTARQQPGVEEAALSSGLPLSSSLPAASLTTPDKPLARTEPGKVVELLTSTPDIFKTLGVSILRGRAFNEQDTQRTSRVAVINQGTARALFGSGNAIGREIVVRYGRFSGEPEIAPETLVVVGIASDTDAGTIGERRSGVLYVPLAQRYEPRISVVVRAQRPEDAVPALQAVISRIDPEIALTELGTAVTTTGASNMMLKVMAGTSGLLGSLALVLAMVGLYGVLSHLTAHRTRELGIRMALGADRARILRMMVGDGLRPVVAGIAVGLGFGAVARFAIRPLFVRLLPAMDATALVTVPILFVAFAVVACYFPARRAAAVDPSVALRDL